MPAPVTWMLIVLFAVLQSSVVAHARFFGFMPELLLIFSVYLGTCFDWRRGFWWGVSCGLVLSVFSISDVRYCMFVLALAGLIAGSFRGVAFVQNTGTKLIILFFISIGEALLFAAFEKGSASGLLHLSFFINYLLKIAFVNCLFALPIYIFLSKYYPQGESR